MKKLFTFSAVFVIFFLTSVSIGAVGDIDLFLSGLEENGFIVQEGEFFLVDAIELFNSGIINTCNGNNAGNLYFSYKIPPGPGQTLPNLIIDLVYPLRYDEALVFAGKTPPEMKYFSYRSFMVYRYIPGINNYKKIYASLGDTINHLTISTQGTPGGEGTWPFSQDAIIITTADENTDSIIRDIAENAGYPPVIINTDILPSPILNMGLHPGCDYFSFLARTAMYIDTEACEQYLQNPGVRVFRLTPKKESVPKPFSTPWLRIRGTGKTEMDLMPAVEELRNAIMTAYSNYDAVELQTVQWLPDAFQSLQTNEDMIGESRDTTYLRTGSECEFFLGDDPGDFLIVYGVNHNMSGKSIYSNFIAYGAQYLNGVASVNNFQYQGSAAQYIPGHKLEKYLYAWKISRNAGGDEYCLEVPTGPEGYGVPLSDKLFIGFRSYIETATKTGPSYGEIIYDRVIHFTPSK